MNTDNGVVPNGRCSLLKRVTSPYRRGPAAASSRTDSGNWTAEQMEWARLRSVILDALEQFPGAREAVVRALVKLRDLEKIGSG